MPSSQKGPLLAPTLYDSGSANLISWTFNPCSHRLWAPPYRRTPFARTSALGLGNADPVPQTSGEGRANSAAMSGPTGQGRGRKKAGVETDKNALPLQAWSCLGSVEVAEKNPQLEESSMRSHALVLHWFHLLSTQGSAHSRLVAHLLGKLGGTCIPRMLTCGPH